MEKQNKSTGKTALIVLLLLVTIVSLVLATYAWAKYTTTEEGTATAQVAKWNVSFTSEDDSFVGTYSHVVTGKMAPGTTGTFDVTVNPGNTEVCFDYTMKIDNIQFLNGQNVLIPDETEIADGITIADLKSHITFTNEDNVDVTKGAVTSGTFDLTGHNTTSAAPADDKDGTETFTWTWPYSTDSADANVVAAYDAIDTAAGEYANANGLQMKVNYTVTAVQVKPAASN